MEEAVRILIYIHAFFGGTGLMAGMGSLIAKKGSPIHKKTGKIFSYAMIISTGISLIIARMPDHKNLFLFLIGIFTLYLVMAGNRALTFKNKSKRRADAIDSGVSGLMCLASVLMILLGLMGLAQGAGNAVLYMFFGGFGAYVSLKDFQTFRKPAKIRKNWLKMHLGRMMGALIASFTAFLVAGLQIGGLITWMIPTILGTLYILYWNRKIRKKRLSKTRPPDKAYRLKP